MKKTQRFCKNCNRLTNSSNLKKIKIKRVSFHICLSCGSPYEFRSFGHLGNILVQGRRPKQVGVTKFGKAGTSPGTYKLYLQTNHWQDFRRKKLKSKPLCEECKEEKATQVHHLRYNDEEGQTILYREKLSDVCSLCKDCHEKVHHI